MTPAAGAGGPPAPGVGSRRSRLVVVGWLSIVGALALFRTAAAQEVSYEILAVRYATIEGFPLRGLLPDTPEGEALDIAMAVWVVRGGGHVVLFDSGFFRQRWFDRFAVRGYVRPDEALRRAGIDAADVTDLVVSHAHWDHMGGVELFPDATIWIQADELTYYAGAAWQEGGRHGGIDPADISHLIERNMDGSVRLVPGDEVEILPGITAYRGARHTYASQYLRVEAGRTFVLASDNAYLYRNIEEHRASATFSPDDRAANVAALDRMVELAGDAARIVPGHDALVFKRYPLVAPGVVRITP